MVFIRRRLFTLAAAVLFCAGTSPASPSKVIARIDLSRPFHLRPGATLVATQGPEVEDPTGDPSDLVPGKIHLCLRGLNSRQCAPDLDSGQVRGDPDLFDEIHFLQDAALVHPRGLSAPPLLIVRTASFVSGDSDQIHTVQLVTYDRSHGRFAIVFREQAGHNNNQEMRYVESGPLRGSMIVAQSPWGPPFTYLVTVHRLTPGYTYKQVLRYRSATRYGDGNPLAVIDSEMPNILGRLGLWRPGRPLPAPKGCGHPHLVKGALWCS